jgi:conjugal transfer pilus assembly protein TraK
MKSTKILSLLVFSGACLSASAQSNEVVTPAATAPAATTTPAPEKKPVKILIPRVSAAKEVMQVPEPIKAEPVKATPKVATQELPGLGKMPGETVDNKIKSVRVGSDRNEIIYISLGQLNKISTPYDNPQIIDSTEATLKAVGQDLFILPSNDRPLTVYITNGGVGQSIGLTLVPKSSLPAQSIVLLPETPNVSSAGSKPDAEDVIAGDYVSRINQLIKQLALGKTPPGFTRSRLPQSVLAGSGVSIEPQLKYAGSSYDIYSYSLKSVSAAPIELKEDAFFNKEVRAVAFFPLNVLQSGEVTTVFVIADRPSKGGDQ